MGPDPRNFNQRVSLGRNDLLIRTFPNIPDTDTRRVMYMEGCDMLSKDTMNEIRNAVKSPPDKLKIYRNGERIVKIEVMEERNEITL
ncbi:hypothetical protein [Enterobacter asburiae]|uniref:hypothetical protein n=1 Tax=Enterobacter asburiae TaxID=61645 RepID=UPI001CC28552|nr:hypothetical protein [Enterobacter asburiae]